MCNLRAARISTPGVESALEGGHEPTHSPHRRKAPRPGGGASAGTSLVPPEAPRGRLEWSKFAKRHQRGLRPQQGGGWRRSSSLAASPRLPPEGGTPSAQAPGLTMQVRRLGASSRPPRTGSPGQAAGHGVAVRTSENQSPPPPRRAGPGAAPSFLGCWSPSLPPALRPRPRRCGRLLPHLWLAWPPAPPP